MANNFQVDLDNIIDCKTWPSLPENCKVLLERSKVKSIRKNFVTVFYYMHEDERKATRQRKARRSLFYERIEHDLKNTPRKYWDRDFLNRVINVGDIVLIMGKIDPRPLVVITTGITKTIYLEDPISGGRVGVRDSKNLLIITDQLRENKRRDEIEIDSSNLKNFRNF